MTEATRPMQYRLSPLGGRVAKARQVPDALIPAEQIEQGMDNFKLIEAIEQSFFRYARHGAYVGIVENTGLLENVYHTHLYCDRTDQKIATITITKEQA